MKSIVTKADMQLVESIFPFSSPQALPLSFVCDGVRMQGVPSSFAPKTEVRMPDANLIQYTVEGEDAAGLHIRVECTHYRDYAATEYLAFFSNRGREDSAMLSDVRIIDGVLPFSDAVLIHGNGDTLGSDGYEWYRDPIDHPIVKAPADGTSCNGAFPYMRLQGEEWGVNIAVGWPAMWQAEFTPAQDGVQLSIGQKRCHMRLHPGETMRTPRVNFVAYTGKEERGVNMWRRWYFDHILPRENGHPLPPKSCLHVFGANSMPEFTGADEDNQMGGIRDYLQQGVRPDIWWVDAGWYPCGGDWTKLGDWRPDPARFPKGLTPIGDACKENDIQFLLWFEPERAREHSPLVKAHPEWILRWKQEDGSLHQNCLVNLGDPSCCDWVIETVDRIIKESRVSIYRQDFNFNPEPYWIQAEAEDRIGAIENLHVQGYLRFWDALILRNPGLWIDSCASGGRRNDLETMRRAVPLHYTDVGYGNHPIKQKQHWQMFAWIPYFRAHNMNWDDPETGEYGTQNRAPDRFSYYAAMAPSLTDMIEHDADAEAFQLARRMQGVWRKAAVIMLNADYYPLTECRKSAEDWYAVQFHNPDTDSGLVEFIRNNRAAADSEAFRLHALQPDHCYLLTDAESGESFEADGKSLTDWLSVTLPRRTGKILFYQRKADH